MVPTGDGFVQTAPTSSKPVLAISTTPGWVQPVQSGRASYGSYAISPYGTEALVREQVGTQSDLKLVSVNGPMSMNGQPERFPPRPYYVSGYRPGDPAVAQEPGKGVRDPSARTYVAFLGVEVGTRTAQLFVDYQNGRHLDTPLEPTAVVPAGEPCLTAAPSFSPDRTRLAYLVGVGPATSPCSTTEVRVVTAGADGTYAADSAKTLARSPDGAPYVSISWRAVAPAATSVRFGGSNRYDVGVTVARSFFGDASAGGAVVAGGDAFADALAGSPLAAASSGPLVLTRRDRVEPGVLAELTRVLKPNAPIYVLGGEATVSAAVIEQLSALGHPVTRLGGANRFAVAVAVARKLDQVRGTAATSLFVANGAVFPDALVAGPAVAVTKGAVLLSNGDTLPPETKAYLDEVRPTTLYGVGGGGSRSLAAYPSAVLIDGADRYAVAKRVADRFFSGQRVATLVSGRDWPDATIGGAIMGTWRQPLLLANGATLPPETAARLRVAQASTDLVFTFGGPASVDQGAVESATSLAGRQTVYYGPDLPR